MTSSPIHVFSFIAGLMFGGALFVQAQTDPVDQLTFPIPELGNCEDRSACEAYCDQTEHMASCVSFADVHDLLSQEDIDIAKKMLALGETAGPGGCTGRENCEAYCDRLDHIKECVVFAENNDLIPADELEEAKKIVQAMDQGIVPPQCTDKKSCDVYCQEADHMQECMEFAIAAGLMPPEEVEEATKMLAAIKNGAVPPACAGKDACDVYCQEADHMQECMEFALAAGFMEPEEAENAQKMLEAIKQGITPPKCQGEEECDVYCQEADHMQECMEFAIAAGFMKEEEAENAKKMLEAIKQGIKPPDCRGEEECKEYCAQEEHREECLKFAQASGNMSAEDAERARQGGPGGCQSEDECKAFCSDPANTEVCMQFGAENGDGNRAEGDDTRERRNDQFAPREGDDGEERTPEDRGGTNQMTGPGGCTTKEACEAFCSDPNNTDVCMNFGGDRRDDSSQEGETGERSGEGMGFSGPGGCTTEEACKTFCENPDNAEVCGGFGPRDGEEDRDGAQEFDDPRREGGDMDFVPGTEQRKCSGPEECGRYCLENPGDPICKPMEGAPREDEQISPPPEEGTERPQDSQAGDEPPLDQSFSGENNNNQ